MKSEDLLQKVREIDPNAFGNLKVQNSKGTYFITGTLYSTQIEDVSNFVQERMAELAPDAMVFTSIQEVGDKLSVTYADDDGNGTAVWSEEPERPLDEVSTLYLGELPTHMIETHPLYKRTNFETMEKVKNIVAVLDFYQPLVLDKNFKVIDGNLRLEIAEILERETLPVIVLSCEGDRADFLRLTLNRSPEFQRWLYDDVDAFVDSLPQAQPLLEPLGFFSNNILPTTFFGNTIIEYTLDEYNSQMKMYSQDIGLADWAEMMREQRLKEEEEKLRRKKFKPSASEKQSLFDLSPVEKNFVPVEDPENAVDSHVEKMKEAAGTITDNYDEVRRAQMEAKGQEWQGTRRTSKRLAADKRAEAEADTLIDEDTSGMEEGEG